MGYMREFWVKIGTSPILYRYIDWSITVPLQMIEFYLILSAVQKNISVGVFWRLLIGTVVMLAFGYMGEAGFVNAWFVFYVWLSHTLGFSCQHTPAHGICVDRPTG